MSLNPSNQISEQVTGRHPFPNLAGVGKRDPAGVDNALAFELNAAGIPVKKRYESQREREGGEPQSIVYGELFGWTFTRAWYYWCAHGPGLTLEFSEPLHEEEGQSVRVEGHCGCPSPREYCKGLPVTSYHIDNQIGLNALVRAIAAQTAKEAQAMLNHTGVVSKK